MTTLTPDSTPAEVRKAWADRLRNPGDIVQGRDMLAPAPGQRCCLGVLCDMAVEAGVIKDYDGGEVVPPTVAERWAGFRDDGYRTGVTGLYSRHPHMQASLIDLNDYPNGFTFADIADLLDDGLVLGPDGNVLEA